MALTRRSLIWVDSAGFTRQTLLAGNASLAAVQAALLAQSNAAESSHFEGPLVVVGAPVPIVAQFQSVLDAAILTFATTAPGANLTITLPAPKIGVFQPDQETVNPAAIAAIIAAVIGTVSSTAGAVATAFISGTRRRLQ